MVLTYSGLERSDTQYLWEKKSQGMLNERQLLQDTRFIP